MIQCLIAVMQMIAMIVMKFMWFKLTMYHRSLVYKMI